MQQPTPQWPARPGLVPALAVAAAPLQGHCDRPDGAPVWHRGAVQSSRRESRLVQTDHWPGPGYAHRRPRWPSRVERGNQHAATATTSRRAGPAPDGPPGGLGGAAGAPASKLTRTRKARAASPGPTRSLEEPCVWQPHERAAPRRSSHRPSTEVLPGVRGYAARATQAGRNPAPTRTQSDSERTTSSLRNRPPTYKVETQQHAGR